MSIKSAPYYWLECDEDGCCWKSTDSGERVAWSGEWADHVEVFDGDWIEVDGKHYCADHNTGRYTCANETPATREHPAEPCENPVNNEDDLCAHHEQPEDERI